MVKKFAISMPLAMGWAAVEATLAEQGSPLVLISVRPSTGSASDERHVRLDLAKRMFIDRVGEAPSAVQTSLVEKAGDIAGIVSRESLMHGH